MRPELATLDRRFMLVPQEVALPMGVVTLEKPRSADDLISEADFAEDDRLPYWADLWPAAIVLSTWLETHPVAGARRRRPPPPERARLRARARDHRGDPPGLRRPRNALTVTGREPAVRMVDWRSFPDDLGTFDLVLAADVLYERPYAPLVAEAIRRTLGPDGRALVSDQGRVALGDFLVEAKARHLVPRIVHHETRPTVPAAPEGSAVHSITVYELRHA